MFEFLTKLFTKSSKAGYSVYMNNRQAQWSKREYKAFADEGYRKNVIAFQAINKKAKAVSQIPWKLVTPEEKEVTDGPMIEMMKNPNPDQSLKEWIEASVGFYCISGNIYWEKTDVSETSAPEMYALRPDRMTVKLGEDGLAAMYKYKVGSQQSTVWEADEGLIRHIKTFNPLDDIYGMSPIESAAYSIDQHNESNTWLQSLLQNGASPSGVMQSEDELGEEQYNRLKAEIDEKFSGSRNAGRPLLLENGMSWQSVGLSPQNMSIIETKFSSARDIALAFEVPPLLLSIQGDSTYSNYKEARLAFYEETVIPLAELLVDEFNRWNADRLGNNRVVLDLEKIPAIIEKRMDLWSMADASQDLTINERRKIKGFEEIEGGDELYIEQSKIPLSFDSNSFDEEPDAEKSASEAYGNIQQLRK